MEWDKIYIQYMYSYPHKTAYKSVNHLDLSKWRNAFQERTMGLYFHIPFCKSKCGFCNLFSLTNIDRTGYTTYLDTIERHSMQMNREIDFTKTDFTSLVLGGGTPMILSEHELESIFLLTEKDYRFNFKQNFSVIESSPSAVENSKLKLLQEYSFKRLSMGIQSFVDRELRTLERSEDPSVVYQALESIRKHDFEILNIDLIYGTPGQTAESFLYSLKEALKFEPEELFLYPLYKQENARLYHKFMIDHRLQYELYQIGRDFLTSNGYHQLSMRSFSKKKAQNPDCGFENTLSLGCGGRSYFDELHFCEKYVSEREDREAVYLKYLQKDDFLTDVTMFLLDEDERKRKYSIKNLLYITGLSEEDYRRHFGTDFLEDFPFIKDLIEKGQVDRRDHRLFLSQEGMGLSDHIGPMFMSQKVREKLGYE